MLTRSRTRRPSWQSCDLRVERVDRSTLNAHRPSATRFSETQTTCLTCASVESTDKASSLRRPNGIHRVRIMAIVNPSPPPLVSLFLSLPSIHLRDFLRAITSPELEQCEGIVFIPKPLYLVMQLLFFRLLFLGRNSVEWEIDRYIYIYLDDTTRRFWQNWYANFLEKETR